MCVCIDRYFILIDVDTFVPCDSDDSASVFLRNMYQECKKKLSKD